MRRLLLIALLATACSDDDWVEPPKDGAAGAMDAPAEAGTRDAGSEGGLDAVPMTTSALERPSDLPRPPNGRLPADLLPPSR